MTLPTPGTGGREQRYPPRPPAPDGVLVVDKPAGPTSHDVVARVRRILGGAKVGHTGTLDPSATGVLPLVVGRATRLARFLSADDKVYTATIRFGVATDTYDAEGTPVGVPWGGLTAAEGLARAGDRTRLEEALAAFTGTFAQRPPPFSAKQVGGVRAYAQARDGQPVALDPVMVTVHRLALVAVEDDRVLVEVAVSPGFYVRALAHDLGARLGIGAHLETLRRTRSGPFTLAQALALDALEQDPAGIVERLLPLDGLLGEWPGARVTAAATTRVRHGGEVGPADMARPPEETAPAGLVRLLGPDGRLLAIAEPADRPGFLHPVVVLG